jgi:hypothetical protein
LLLFLDLPDQHNIPEFSFLFRIQCPVKWLCPVEDLGKFKETISVTKWLIIINCKDITDIRAQEHEGNGPYPVQSGWPPSLSPIAYPLKPLIAILEASWAKGHLECGQA